MDTSLETLLRDNPVIASVKSPEGLDAALDSDCRLIFLLYGSLVSIEGIVERLVDAGKVVFVDVDLVDGFAVKDIVIQYLQERVKVDGILSSKASMVKAAKELGLIAIHRAFLIDSFSYHSVPKQLKSSRADAVEILPGCVPRVISWLLNDVEVPIIAGGLVCDREDVMAALNAGAAAIATSDREVWRM